jgi:DnaJ family protein C protein 2
MAAPVAAQRIDLFAYTEEQLLEDCELTHYEILNCPEFATQDEIKKAYRKASLKYHPDKTGRDSEDYIFLAVKGAHDVLFNEEKRKAYDSTTMPFDDKIPNERAKMMEDSKYKDEDYYETFGKVFTRNLRFDARLRPEAAKTKGKKGNKKNGSNGGGKPKKPPVVGHADTPMEEVHAFYDYWIHFESWRDFSSQAAEELEVEDEMENAESRFEKRWINKEIEKRCKQLKRAEMTRIQLLVTRAMEADPRMRKERQEAIEAKEQAKVDREAAAKKEVEDAAQKLIDDKIQAEADKIRLAEEKVEREKDKKQLRKAKQLLRRVSLESFESSSERKIWGDSYDMKQDVEILCTSLTVHQIKALAEKVEETTCKDESLSIIHIHVQRTKDSDFADTQAAAAEPSKEAKVAAAPVAKLPWTKDELTALAKAVKKYPPGGASRWEQIALFVNNLCKQDDPRSKEECIEKYNFIAKNAKPNGATGGVGGVGTTPAAAASTNGNGHSNGVVTDDDTWSADEDQKLQDGLVKYPASLEKNERWDQIAKCCPGRSKKECVERFKAIREELKSRK